MLALGAGHTATIARSQEKNQWKDKKTKVFNQHADN
jgi:hypothetical protein